MAIDIKLRTAEDVEAFTEAKLLLMVVHGETEMSNTETVRRLIEALRSLYDEEARRIEEIRTFTTGPDAREDSDE